jgi:hypothetical protein
MFPLPLFLPKRKWGKLDVSLPSKKCALIQSKNTAVVMPVYRQAGLLRLTNAAPTLCIGIVTALQKFTPTAECTNTKALAKCHDRFIAFVRWKRNRWLCPQEAMVNICDFSRFALLLKSQARALDNHSRVPISRSFLCYFLWPDKESKHNTVFSSIHPDSITSNLKQTHRLSLFLWHSTKRLAMSRSSNAPAGK